VADTLVSGRRFRMLTLVDDFTENAGPVVDTSLSGLESGELDRVVPTTSFFALTLALRMNPR